MFRLGEEVSEELRTKRPGSMHMSYTSYARLRGCRSCFTKAQRWRDGVLVSMWGCRSATVGSTAYVSRKSAKGISQPCFDTVADER